MNVIHSNPEMGWYFVAEGRIWLEGLWDWCRDSCMRSVALLLFNVGLDRMLLLENP